MVLNKGLSVCKGGKAMDLNDVSIIVMAKKESRTLLSAVWMKGIPSVSKNDCTSQPWGKKRILFSNSYNGCDTARSMQPLAEQSCGGAAAIKWSF